MEILINLIPAILLIICGFLLKEAKLLKTEDGSSLLKIVFYIGAPAFIYLAIINTEVDRSYIPLLLLAPFVVAITILVLSLLRRTVLKNLPIKTFGAMSLGILIMNTGFLIPFIEQGYGQEGVSRLIITDLGNSLILYSLVYAVAVYFGSGNVDVKNISKKLLYSPPIWAIFIALFVKLLKVETPTIVINLFEIAAGIVSPALLIALGLKFDKEIKHLSLVTSGLLLRFIMGTIIGFAFVYLFNVTDLNAVIIILTASAPFGNNSITFSDLENLDSEYASTQVSAGILFGIIYIPIMMIILDHLFV